MAKKKNASKKPKTRFTTKKILCFASAIFLFSAVVSMMVTAKYGENRAAYFLRGLAVPQGEVVDGALDLEGADDVVIPQGEIGYFLNQSVIFPDGYAQGDVLLQNPEQCGYMLRLRVYLADGSSNRPVYTSPKVLPGQYISGDKLGKFLPAGEYSCTYTVTAYDLQDGSQKGTRSGFMTIAVLS